MKPLYDTIGRSYREWRRPDPRIAAAIERALGDARRIVNVGAGAGSYEPAGRTVAAVELSMTMIRQRSREMAPTVQASAAALPFRDGEFDAALAVLTVHHWPDRKHTLAEFARVAKRRVVLTCDMDDMPPFWLVEDYFPANRDLDRAIFPSMDDFRIAFGGPIQIIPVPVPYDCTDGFLGAYWRRPEMYLDAGARSAISSFARIDGVEASLRKLKADLDDGTWMRRNGALMERDSLDLGYRLVVG